MCFFSPRLLPSPTTAPIPAREPTASLENSRRSSNFLMSFCSGSSQPFWNEARGCNKSVLHARHLKK